MGRTTAGRILALAVALRTADAAEWKPAAWADTGTIELRTVGAEEGEHWFPVWVAVIDGQVYVRLGSRAATRIEKNQTAPYVGVRVGGEQFDRIKAIPAPEYRERVAQAMAAKYWSDLVVHLLPHPLTLRLVPEPPGQAVER